MEKQNKKTALIGLVIVILFLTSLVVLLALSEKQKPVPVNQFANCDVLSNSCKDQSCKYLFLCNEIEFSDCQVFDCGDKYGMKILDKQGNLQEKIKEKPDQKKIQEVIEKCKGSLEIFKKIECEENKARATVKISTEGDCKINSFIMKVNDNQRIANFEKEGNIYNLSVGQCGEISEIMAVGESGVQIREMKK